MMMNKRGMMPDMMGQGNAGKAALVDLTEGEPGAQADVASEAQGADPKLDAVLSALDDLQMSANPEQARRLQEIAIEVQTLMKGKKA